MVVLDPYLFAIFGRFILDYLHITIEALQVSGGLLLLLVAMQLLTGSGENEQLESGTNIAIVPLRPGEGEPDATPLYEEPFVMFVAAGHPLGIGVP